jgi:hypothetical protein
MERYADSSPSKPSCAEFAILGYVRYDFCALQARKDLEGQKSTLERNLQLETQGFDASVKDNVASFRNLRTYRIMRPFVQSETTPARPGE